MTQKINENKNEILFGFLNSFVVFEFGILSTQNGEFFNFKSLEGFRVDKPKGFLSKKGYFTKDGQFIDNLIGSKDLEGKMLKKFVFYLNGERDEEIKKDEQLRETHLKRQKKIKTQNKKELEELDTIVSITNKLVELREEQTKLKSKNELKYRIILNEKLLNNLPNQTYGSVIFYNELNKNSTLFDNSHLNKTTRFLNFIETHEDKYLRLYDRCVGLYIDDPNNKCFNELIIKLETINHYYEIMKSLINNVNKDKVLYNKLYNLIEDEGIFMTKTEKESLNYMKKVSSGVIELNKNIVDGFNILESQLSDVSSGLSDLDSGLLMISSSMDDINMNLSDTRRR